MAELAAEQWGVLSTAELYELGLTPSSITRRRQRGQLHQLYLAVWSIGHANPPWEGRLLAAVKACGPDALLSHYSAAELWGYVERLERRPDVTVVGAPRRTPRGISVHRTAFLDPMDRRERSGIPVTSPARTLLDLGAMLNERRTRAAIRRALGKGTVAIRQLGLALERYPRRRGSGVVRAAIDAGFAPTKSDRESDVLDVILSAGFVGPEVNRPLVLGSRRVIPDFRWPAQRLILEVDSTAWHDDPLARADDRERQALLEAHGETVLRVHWRDAVLAPSKLEAELRDAGAPYRVERRFATDPR